MGTPEIWIPEDERCKFRVLLQSIFSTRGSMQDTWLRRSRGPDCDLINGKRIECKKCRLGTCGSFDRTRSTKSDGLSRQ